MIRFVLEKDEQPKKAAIISAERNPQAELIVNSVATVRPPDGAESCMPQSTAWQLSSHIESHSWWDGLYPSSWSVRLSLLVPPEADQVIVLMTLITSVPTLTVTLFNWLKVNTSKITLDS